MAEIPVGKAWQVKVSFKINRRAEHFIIALGVATATDINLRTSWSQPFDLAKGNYEATFLEDNLIFSPGCYNLTLGLSNYERPIHFSENLGTFTISEVNDASLEQTILRTANVGIFLNPMNITISSPKN